MRMIPVPPPKTWYRHFWYAEQSPVDRLVDRLLFFAIAALAVLAGAMTLVNYGPNPHRTALQPNQPPSLASRQPLQQPQHTLPY